MNCKLCPYCHQPSYSAATHGKWFCPHCKKDLTLVKFSPIIYNKDAAIEFQETKKD